MWYLVTMRATPKPESNLSVSGGTSEALAKLADASLDRSKQKIVSKRAVENKKVIKASLLQKRPVHESQQRRPRHLVTLIIQGSMCECSVKKKKLPNPSQFQNPQCLP
jgi:hypothetical protein